MERVETIAEVKTKELPTGVTLYLLFDSEGREYSTRDRDLARVGHGAQESGQHVHLDFDEKQGGQFGQFTNRYLNEIKLVEDGTTPTNGGSSERPPSLFDDAEPESVSREAPLNTGRFVNVDAEKNLNIAKAVGLKAGVEVLQYLPAEERTVSNVVTAAEFFTQWLVTWRP